MNKEKKLTIVIPEELHNKFKSKTAANGTTMKDTIIMLIEAYVSDM